jgi:alkylated DNA nucleotide flippase Atl1
MTVPAMTSTRSDHAGSLAAEPRWELLRSLGAAVLTPPPGNRGVCEALDLPSPTGVEHTDAFVLSAPPHAAIHLGPEGKLGGEGLDRIAGFWRVMGLRAPEDADHLGTLLMFYAELGEAEAAASHERGRAQLHRARATLFHEHIWSWAPGYLLAVSELGIASVAAWAQLTEQALSAEYAQLGPAAMLPLALRTAPPPMATADSLDETLDALVAPIRSGMVLTYRDLAECAHQVGVGLRRGERRFALRAMLEQEPQGTLSWLGARARRTSQRCTPTPPMTNDPGAWWSRRAAETARVLETLVGEGEQT